MWLMPRRQVSVGPVLALLSTLTLLAAPSVSAGDLIHRDLPADLPDARRVVEPSHLTDGVLARETVRVDAALLVAEPETLWLELAPGEWRLAFRSSVEHTPIGGLVWRGRFADDDPDRATIILTAYDGLVHGSFLDEGVSHALRPAGGAASELVTIGASGPLGCGGAIGAAEDEAMGGGTSKDPAERGAGEVPFGVRGWSAASGADGRTLSILVVYTPNLAEVWGGHRYAVANAHHAVDWLNTAFQNSRIQGDAFLSGVAPWAPTGVFVRNPAAASGSRSSGRTRASPARAAPARSSPASTATVPATSGSSARTTSSCR